MTKQKGEDTQNTQNTTLKPVDNKFHITKTHTHNKEEEKGQSLSN